MDSLFCTPTERIDDTLLFAYSHKIANCKFVCARQRVIGCLLCDDWRTV